MFVLSFRIAILALISGDFGWGGIVVREGSVWGGMAGNRTGRGALWERGGQFLFGWFGLWFVALLCDFEVDGSGVDGGAVGGGDVDG